MSKKKRATDKSTPQKALKTDSAPKPFGRPTSYKPEYCQMIIDTMGQGFSKIAFAGKIGVASSTIYEWEKNQPDFSNAVKLAEDANAQFWENMGIMGAMGAIEGFNATAWIFNMKNRHKWRDKQPEEVSNVNINVEKLPDSELEALILKAASEIKGKS